MCQNCKQGICTNQCQTINSLLIDDLISNKIKIDSKKPAYLLLPNERPLILWRNDGYGIFNGIDVFKLLTLRCFEREKLQLIFDSKGCDKKNIFRNIGISIYGDEYCVSASGKEYIYADMGNYKPLNQLFEKEFITFQDYQKNQLIDGLSLSINQHIDAGSLRLLKFSDLVNFDLQVSFNPNELYQPKG